jgi:hypothetical protein
MQQSQQQGQAQQGGQQHVRHGSVGKSQQSQHVSHGSIGSGSQLGSGSGGTAGHLDFDDAPHEEKDVAEGTDDFSASYDARTERKISADQSVHTPDTVGRAITGNSGGGIGVAEASQVSRGGGATGSTAHAEDDDGPSRTGRMSSRRQGASSGGGGLGAMQDGEQEHQSEKSTREQQRGASVSHHAAATDPPQSLHLDDDDSAHHSGAAAASSSASLDPSDPLSSPILGSPVEWDADESLLEGGIQVIKLPRKSGFFGPSPRKVTMVLTQGSVSSTLKGQWLLHWASKKKTREEDFVNLSAMHGYQRGLDRGGFKDSKDLQREYAGREEQCFTLSIPSRELMIIVEKKSDAQALDRVLTRIAHPSGVHRTPSYIGAASPSKSKAKESTFQPGQPPKTPRSTRSGSPAGSPVSASQSPGASPPPKMAFPSFASSPVLAPHGSPKPGGLGLAAAAGGSRAAGVGAGQGSAAVGVGAATNVQAQVGSSPSIAQLAEHSRESSQASLSQQPARKSASLSAAQPAAQQSAN